MITSALANLRSVKRSIAMIVHRLTGAEQHQGKQYVQEFLHLSVHDCRKVYIMIKDETGRVSMLHIVDDFTVFYVREHLTFLFLRER